MSTQISQIRAGLESDRRELLQAVRTEELLIEWRPRSRLPQLAVVVGDAPLAGSAGTPLDGKERPSYYGDYNI